MIDVTELFCKVDEFFKSYETTYKAKLIEDGRIRQRYPELSESEMMTVLILFHYSCYRNFKGFYNKKVRQTMQKEFPKLVSYNRFIQLMPRIVMPMIAFMNSIKGKSTGISFMDSTTLTVCHKRRINRNKVFKNLAQRGRTTMGWFFGFKLHLIVNHLGEIISFQITQGNVDDRAPVPKMTQNVQGKIFADKGYISQPLFKNLFEKGAQLITNIKSNMKNRLLPLMDRIMLKKRFIIETINNQLKNVHQIDHSRHRSPINFLINILAALSAYQLKPKKPAIKLNINQLPLPF